MNDSITSTICVATLGVALVVVAIVGANRAGQLYDLKEDQCSLCPDKEEEQCAEDDWSLDYILEHCYGDTIPPKVEVPHGEALRILVLEEKVLLCTTKLNRSRRHTDRLRDHIDVLMDVCRKEHK